MNKITESTRDAHNDRLRQLSAGIMAIIGRA